MTEQRDLLYKVLVIGGPGACSHALMRRCVRDEAYAKERDKVGFHLKIVNLSEDCVRLQLLSVPSQWRAETYDATRMPYVDTQGVFIAFDVTRVEETLPIALAWKKEVDTWLPGVTTVLLANHATSRELPNDELRARLTHVCQTHGFFDWCPTSTISQYQTSMAVVFTTCEIVRRMAVLASEDDGLDGDVQRDHATCYGKRQEASALVDTM